MHFVDAGINAKFLEADIPKLSSVPEEIIIINTTDPDFDFSHIKSQNPNKIFLTRLTLQYSIKLTRIKQYSNFNIIAINITDFTQLKNVISLQPDLISFAPTIHLKAGLIRDAMFKNIYFEISNDLRVNKDLISITKGKNCVYGSNANNIMHIKKYDDICMFLKGFHYKHDLKVVVNCFLKACWEKRYSYRGVLTNDVVKDDFKKLFLPDEIEK